MCPEREKITRYQDRAVVRTVLVALLVICCAFPVFAQQSQPEAPKMTGRYHFLGPQDVLAILQEEDMLKGYIDAFQGEDESDAILSYPFVVGSRHGDHVEFTTRKIHEVYYRFNGTVQRGKGRKPGDPDYLELAGELETVHENSVTGEHKVQKQQVVFKSWGKGERPEE